jgi:hypothetical protein
LEWLDYFYNKMSFFTESLLIKNFLQDAQTLQLH